MSRRLDRWRGRLAADRPEVVVCRGGDCGSRRKHPQLDHAAQLARVREALQGDAAVAVSKCLDECDHSNVLVVTPGRTAREAGAQPVWMGGVLDDEATDAVIACARMIGARAEPSAAIVAHRFTPTRPGPIRRTAGARDR